MALSSNPLSMLMLVLWAVFWLVGGWWLVRAAFRLEASEELITGAALGWVVQNWLANLIARILPVAPAFWLAALLVFIGGGLAAGPRLGWKELVRGRIAFWQVFVLLGITWIFFSISRGLAIFDDFQHLPTVSLIAAGDFPPHFVLDPAITFGYHHFLQLFSAQVMRLGSLTPWISVDFGRALSFGLAVLLAFLWTRRMTRSAFGGLLGGAMIAFGSGTRWLLLLLPPGLVVWLGKNVQLIGSGAGSGTSLRDALTNTWAVEGAGPIGFPFAFANGIFPPGVIQALTANGLMPFVMIFLLLLTCNRWRTSLAAVLSAILISAWGLLGEAELPGILLGWGIVAAIYALQCKTLHFPRRLVAWLGVAAAGVLIGFLEGGALTDVLFRALERLSGGTPPPSYQTIGFALAFPPVVVSSHLGVLSLFNPGLLLLALFELGPVLLVLPLLAVWGLRAFRSQLWFEAALAATTIGMLLMVFVQFNGSTGVRNTPRLYVFMPLLAALAVPLVWNWTMNHSSSIKMLAGGLGLVTVLGGLLMFGVELVAAQRPVYSYFITPLDARMASAYWNRLAPGALVFDPIPYRAPTLFGRHTDSSLTWYQTKPAWDLLEKSPDPVRLHAAGFGYLYLDKSNWDALGVAGQQALAADCVRLVNEVSDSQNDFRKLFDLRTCQ